VTNINERSVITMGKHYKIHGNLVHLVAYEDDDYSAFDLMPKHVHGVPKLRKFKEKVKEINNVKP